MKILILALIMATTTSALTSNKKSIDRKPALEIFYGKNK